MRERRLRLTEEAAVLPDQLTVGVDLPFAAQVADQVEVQRRAVAPAEDLEAHAEREVNRAADLLVEEDVAGEAVDLVVEAERELADPARSFVHLEQRREIRLAFRRLGGDHTAVLEA